MTQAAPYIPGLEVAGYVGEGGYADVYLYRQLMPERLVAVKVLRDQDLTEAQVRAFTAEANALARLEHPNIVPVYSAGLTADSRPYMVMMYYPNPTLRNQIAQAPLAVAETLRVGVKVGCAVETAHRSGLLHRDIKPGNILTSQYGEPGLADFGIAAQLGAADDEDSGVSIPWAPPELIFGTTPATAGSDVYSLAATLWQSLVGRTPFEVPGGDNRRYALMCRVRDEPCPSTGRPDVPLSLDRLLKQAMAKGPAARPRSMYDFVQSLLTIEQELGYARTPLVLPATPSRTAPAPSVSAQDDDATRRRATRVGGATSSAAAAPASPRLVAGAVSDDASTVRRPRAAPAVVAPPQPEQPEETRRTWAYVGAAALLVVAAVVGGVIVTQGGGDKPVAVTTQPVLSQGLGGDRVPPGPVSIKAAASGAQVAFTWSYSARLPDDTYRWRVAGTDEVRTTAEPTVSLPQKPGLCVEVQVVRADGSNASSRWSAPGCAP